jgi:hypothetical protein
MGTNPYEAPRTEISGGGAIPAPGLIDGPSFLPAELEIRAMELLGRKRSRSTGASFAVAGAICVAALAFVTGLFWAFVVGGAIAGAISKAWVRSRTPALVAEVCAELGIAPGLFKPEGYLL